jgi:hypothetical protein
MRSRWSRVLCGRLGWHRPGPLFVADGPLMQAYARCRRCGYYGMIDSQGNLF